MSRKARSVDAQPGSGWNQGQLAHLIPTASHERFLIKASFKAPLASAPRLSVDGKFIEGVQTDAEGRFWRFDVRSLQPATLYELRLTDPGGAPLRDAWPLKTFPAPDATPDRRRILAYTCQGGYDCKVRRPNARKYVSSAIRCASPAVEIAPGAPAARRAVRQRQDEGRQLQRPSAASSSRMVTGSK
jgi:hypothetical protein